MTSHLDVIQEIDVFALPSVDLAMRTSLPQISGIYFAINVQNEILYIGMCKDFRQRWVAHHRGIELALSGEIRIAWLEISEQPLLPEIEKALIAWFKPRFNIHENPDNIPKQPYLYKSQGAGLKWKDKPIPTRYPEEIDKVLRSLPNRSEYIRRAVIRQMKDDGLLL